MKEYHWSLHSYQVLPWGRDGLYWGVTLCDLLDRFLFLDIIGGDFYNYFSHYPVWYEQNHIFRNPRWVFLWGSKSIFASLQPQQWDCLAMLGCKTSPIYTGAVTLLHRLTTLQTDTLCLTVTLYKVTLYTTTTKKYTKSHTPHIKPNTYWFCYPVTLSNHAEYCKKTEFTLGEKHTICICVLVYLYSSMPRDGAITHL